MQQRGVFQESYPGELKYKDFCEKDYIRKCIEEYGKRVRFFKKAVTSLNILSDTIKTSTNSYVHIDNVKSSNRKIVKKYQVEREQNVMFLDMNLTMLQPKQLYFNLMKSIGVEKEKCTAEIVGFSSHMRENKKYSVYPIIAGGSYNPYMKYKSNRSSASRRLKILDLLSYVVPGKFINMMNLNLTLPGEVSTIMLNDIKGKEKHKKIVEMFWKRMVDEDILKSDNKKYLSLKGLDLGRHTNYHNASSTNPFKEHMHSHNFFPNFLYDKEKKRFVKIKYIFEKEDFKTIKKIFYECQKEVLKYGKKDGSLYGNFDIDYEKVNIWFQYFLDYSVDIKKPEKIDLDLNNRCDFLEYREKQSEWVENNKARVKILHQLKYMNRSYLIDVGNYLDYRDLDVPYSKEDYIEKEDSFKKFVEKGAIENRTNCTGYLRNLKRIVKEINPSLYFDLFEENEKEVFDDKTNKWKIKVTIKEKKNDRTTYNCPVTGEEMSKNRDDEIDFVKMKQLSIFIAFKSGVIKIGELKFGEKECLS